MVAQLPGERGRRESLLGIEGQGGADDPHEIFPARLADLGRDACRGAAQHPLVVPLVGAGWGRRRAGEQLDEQRAQAVGVGALGIEALGRAVAFGRGGHGGVAVNHPEAGQLHPAQGVDQDLPRLGAGVDHRLVLLTGDGRGGRVEGHGDGGDDLDGGPQGDALVALLEEPLDVL